MQQGRAKAQWETRARVVEGMIESIENASWNKEGAKEDMGARRRGP